MDQVQQIGIQLAGIGSVLRGKRFKVPAYQRSYAWGVDHVDALLRDLSEAIKSKEKEYFLGSIVVTGAEMSRFDVVDGQQRLTTISLLIAAIKETFSRDGDEKIANIITTDFLSSTDRRTRDKEPKLILNEVDNELYQELIENISDIDASKYTRQSHKRLVLAAKHILTFLEDMAKASKDSDADLHELLDYIEHNTKIIVVSTPDDSNAFIIFETLNDRGLELAISDLLKNYLFHRSGDRIEEAKQRWLSMVSILESASDDPLVVTYLRHFSMSKYGLIREKELFNSIKTRINNKRVALTFATELADTAKIYSALINTEHEYWASFDPKVSICVSDL